MLVICAIVALFASSAIAAPAPQASAAASICFDDLDCVFFVSEANNILWAVFSLFWSVYFVLNGNRKE